MKKLLVPLLLSYGSLSNSNAGIIIKIDLDTTRWAPVAYLSVIGDYTKINSISYSQIIATSKVSPDCIYKFSTKYYPEKDCLYRVHFARRGYPPASLVIGGADQNYFFLFACKEEEINIISEQGENTIGDLNFDGQGRNSALKELNIKLKIFDSLDYQGTQINNRFFWDAQFNEIKKFADTCSYPLVSLYALYYIDYDKDYLIDPKFYHNYLRKWKSEKSEYFEVFRKSLKGSKTNVWLILLISFSGLTPIITVTYKVYLKRKNNAKNMLTELSINERKVFELLKQGKSNKEIASELSISVNTVKSHANSIYSKLKIRSRKELINFDI